MATFKVLTMRAIKKIIENACSKIVEHSNNKIKVKFVEHKLRDNDFFEMKLSLFIDDDFILGSEMPRKKWSEDEERETEEILYTNIISGFISSAFIRNKHIKL